MAIKKLENVAHGMVTLRCGDAVIQQKASNFFIHDADQLYCDEVTKKPLNTTQKPVAFIQQLIELYTSPGDWILDGLSGTGLV